MLINTTETVTEPVDLNAAKRQVNQLLDVDDLHIQDLIVRARKAAEKHCSSVIPLQTFTWTMDAFETELILPVAPVVSIESVKYTDEQGAEIILPDTAYHLRRLSPYRSQLVPAYGTSWPETEPGYDKVVVSFTAGYDPVAEDLQHGILMLAADMYEYRESLVLGVQVSDIPRNSLWLLDPYKVPSA